MHIIAILIMRENVRYITCVKSRKITINICSETSKVLRNMRKKFQQKCIENYNNNTYIIKKLRCTYTFVYDYDKYRKLQHGLFPSGHKTLKSSQKNHNVWKASDAVRISHIFVFIAVISVSPFNSYSIFMEECT